MSLVLDARQRAMLDEMGVKVWLPTARQAPMVVPEEFTELHEALTHKHAS